MAYKSYIALFYSHFGATRYAKLLKGAGWENRMCPVPRSLSSSCGTCVRWEGDAPCPEPSCPEEVEQIVQVLEAGYRTCYRAENS